MKERIFQAPARYVQGRGVLGRLREFTQPLGERPLVLLSPGGRARLGGVLGEGWYVPAAFGGECTMAELERLAALAKAEGCGVIVGAGGGKVLDAAKGAAHLAGLPAIMAPTTAASDAPCSALAVVYREDGSLDTLLSLRRNPDLVLADSEIIAQAPRLLLAAGMGDALATYFEMQACWDTDSDSFVGGRVSLAARAVARQCRDTLLEDGRKAYSAAGTGACTEALERVIEANILLSGIGFESGGVCAAHPINNGLAGLARTRAFHHGEKVAFALVCQLVLADAPLALIREIQRFLRDVGLPVTLAGLGLEEITGEELDFIAAVADGDAAIHALPRRVDTPVIRDAVRAADALGREFLDATLL